MTGVEYMSAPGPGRPGVGKSQVLALGSLPDQDLKSYVLKSLEKSSSSEEAKHY